MSTRACRHDDRTTAVPRRTFLAIRGASTPTILPYVNARTGMPNGAECTCETSVLHAEPSMKRPVRSTLVYDSRRPYAILVDDQSDRCWRCTPRAESGAHARCAGAPADRERLASGERHHGSDEIQGSR